MSIVTISFNQARYLSRAMASVLSQDYPDIEYIVVDPGSTDGSLGIIDQHAHRLAHVVLDPDDGPADGLNHGFSLATGDIVAYINADDALLPGAVREAVDHLTANPEDDVVYGDGYIIDGDGRVVRPIESSPFNLRRYSYGGVTVLQQATFIRRESFNEARGFNTANRTCWDGELLVDIAMMGGRLRRVRRAWGAFAIYPDSITGSRRLWGQSMADQRRIFSKVHGREWRGTDHLVSRLVRVEKWLVSPGTALRRLGVSLGRRPRMRLTVRDGCFVEIAVDG